MKKISAVGMIIMGMMSLSVMSVYAENESTATTESETTSQNTETETSATVTEFQEDILSVVEREGYELLDAYRPEGAIVVDSYTGEIIYGSQIDQPWDPASVTKVMTAYLAFEAMKNGRFSLDTLVTATENDRAISAIANISNNIIVAGVSYSVRDLLTYMMYPSSNVATVMVSRLVDTSDGAFVDRMNQKAKEWGMTHTHFNNASGAAAINYQGLYLPEGYDAEAMNQTTARDLAILAYHLIQDFPEFLSITKNPYATAMEGTPYEESFYTLNYSMPGMPYGYPGVDGIKTGSSESAALNYLITAQQGNSRYIVVVLGVGSWYDYQSSNYFRSQIGNALLNKAFTEYETKTLLSAGEHTVDGVTFKLDKDVIALVRKGEEAQYSLEDHQLVIKSSLPRLTEKLSPLKTEVKIIPKEEVKEETILSQDDKPLIASEDASNIEVFILELKNHPWLLVTIIFAIASVISGIIVGIWTFIRRHHNTTK